jgi:hypothetical protein
LEQAISLFRGGGGGSDDDDDGDDDDEFPRNMQL